MTCLQEQCIRETAAMKERIEQLESELAECRKDAERYRFIKDNPWSSSVADIICHHQNAAWDRVIDVAMKEAP